MQKNLLILIALFGATLFLVRTAEEMREAQKRQPDWDAIPYDFRGWHGRNTFFDPVYGTEPSDSSLLRVYEQDDRSPVIVYIGFYSDLATILEVHTPELCYPAQGWTISTVGRSAAGLFHGHEIPAKEIVAEKAGVKRLVTWWYNAGSEPFETRIRYVYATLAMSTFTGRTDGSLVRIESPIDSAGEGAARERIEEFRRSLLPQLEKALP
jgi:EpsI family protein